MPPVSAESEISVVSSKGIEPDPDKVKSVAEWPIPQTLTELRAFVALASYYRRHIKNFAEIAKPLHNLTKKNQPFKWGIEQNEAFETLKDKLIHYPILSTPQPVGKFVLDSNGSDYALGAVLSQWQEGDLKVIAYGSRLMNSAESSYCTTRKELLAIIYGLKFFRHYLLSAEFL